MRAGFAKRDITPEPDVFLAGNGEYQSEGIHDLLFARALVLSDRDEWVAVVSADLIGIEYETTLAVRRILSESNGVKPENVLISCTHTHNGPHTRFSRKEFLRHRDEAYLERLSELIADAVLEANENQENVSLRYGRGFACENFNRRLTMPDGVTYAYSPARVRAKPEIARYVHGVVDRELDALRLIRADGSVVLTATHYAAHPVTVGVFANVVSADYCGAAVRHVEKMFGSDAMFLQGACGDLHAKGVFEGFDRMEEMGRNLANETGDVLSKCGPVIDNPRLRFARRDVELPTVVSKENADSEKAKLWNLDLFDKVYRTEMAAFTMGPLAFVSSPGELLCEPGLRIKCDSPFEQTWLLYNCNSYSSYIAHRRAYAEGGYEGGWGQCLDEDACYVVLTMAEELLSELANKSRLRRIQSDLTTK